MADDPSAVPPPPSYDVTAREFAELRALGTPKAMAQFLARNPHHPLATEAIALLQSGHLDGEVVITGEPEELLYIAFAKAVQTNSVEGYEEFAALHPNHPLGVMARQLAAKQ